MKISIIGTGYVGLVSGVCLAEKGHEVICVDLDRGKVRQINQGASPIYEVGLDALLRTNLHKRFHATSDLRDAVLRTELSIIAVGTPFAEGKIDLRFIRDAALQVGAALKEKSAYHVVVVKSTVIPGTTDELVLPALECASGKMAGIAFGVGMNPEFLREGDAVKDFLFPDRIVLGGIDARTLERMDEIYKPFSGVDKLFTNPRTAETIKYTANALLATMISFSNEIGNLCSAIGDVDVVDVMRGVHLDKRISPIMVDGKRIKPPITTYLEAGCGFGGSCFPKDVKALISFGNSVGARMHILEAAMDINAAQARKLLSLLARHFPRLKGVRVTILGLAFKPGTNDMRESPSIPVIQELIVKQAVVKAFDPVAASEALEIFGNQCVEYPETLAEAIQGADAIILLTRWSEFEALPRLLATLPEPPVVIDGRRMLDKHSVRNYEGIGLNQTAALQISAPPDVDGAMASNSAGDPAELPALAAIDG